MKKTYKSPITLYVEADSSELICQSPNPTPGVFRTSAGDGADGLSKGRSGNGDDDDLW